MDTEFVDGLIVKAPRAGAPDFVKGSLSIKRVELLAWLNTKQDEWVNVDIKESRNGKWYAQVNSWKPDPAKAGAPGQAAPAAAATSPASAKPDTKEPDLPTVEYPTDDIDPNDIPF